ncbi:unnamed protein product, partial [Ectocarpus sp. 8 AP-2014]
MSHTATILPVASPSLKPICDPQGVHQIQHQVHESPTRYHCTRLAQGGKEKSHRTNGNHATREPKTRGPRRLPRTCDTFTHEQEQRPTATYRTVPLSSHRVGTKQMSYHGASEKPKVSVRKDIVLRSTRQHSTSERVKTMDRRRNVRCGVWEGDARDTSQTSFARPNCCQNLAKTQVNGRTGGGGERESKTEAEEETRATRTTRAHTHTHTHTQKQEKI